MSSPPGSSASDGASFLLSFVVELNYDGWRLDRYLTEKLKRATRSQVRRLIPRAVRFGDDRRVKPGAVVRAGDVVLLERAEVSDPGAPSLSSVSVLDQAADWLVLDKPAGLLVHATARERRNTIERYLSDSFPGERIEPVHRLDRDTSGCLVCGRGLDAIRYLRGLFADSAVDKRYVAVVDDGTGRWQPGAGAVFDEPLGFDGDSSVALRIGHGDWPCKTIVRATERSADRALLDVSIEGGRQHQIRAHLALAGTPIVGDKLYGLGDAFFLDWIERPGAPDLVDQLPVRWHALHAASVRVDDPGFTITAASPLPNRVLRLGRWGQSELG